jgi:hypothetical protein
MKKESPSVDILHSLLNGDENGYWVKFRKEIKRTVEEAVEEAIKNTPPTLPPLEKLTEGKTPVLRKWTGGKYKCASLEEFIKAYIIIVDNLTPALIRDYLICEKTGKPYSNNSIEKGLSLHGPGRK